MKKPNPLLIIFMLLLLIITSIRATADTTQINLTINNNTITLSANNTNDLTINIPGNTQQLIQYNPIIPDQTCTNTTITDQTNYTQILTIISNEIDRGVQAQRDYLTNTYLPSTDTLANLTAQKTALERESTFCQNQLANYKQGLDIITNQTDQRNQDLQRENRSLTYALIATYLIVIGFTVLILYKKMRTPQGRF